MSSKQGGSYLARPAPSGLADVVEIILDKGLVIDAYVRVSLLGIELVTLDARVVVASVDTYLRFAEATHRLDLWEQGGRSLPDMVVEEAGDVVETVAGDVVGRKVDSALDSVGDTIGEPVEKVARAAGRTVVDAAAEVASKAAERTGE